MRRLFGIVVGVALGVAGATPGCTGTKTVTGRHEGATVDGGANGETRETGETFADQVRACSAYVRAQCARKAECFGETGACLTDGDPCPYFLFQPGSTRTVESTLRCAAQFKTWSCDDFTNNRYPDCVSVGTLKKGEACSVRAQCATDYCTNDVCGACGEVVEPGAACDRYTSFCPSGTTCTAGHCVDLGPPASAEGDACTMEPGCVAPLECVTPGDGGPGHCVGPRGPGQPCDGTGCATGAYCGKDETCHAVPGLGEPCGIEPFDYPACADGTRCLDLVCSRPGEIGEPCEPRDDTGPQCVPTATCKCAPGDCSRYVCTEIRLPGESCSISTYCANDVPCTDGFCPTVEWPPPNVTCGL